MLNKLLKYPKLTEEVILYSTLLANSCSKIYIEDVKKLIGFICDANNKAELKEEYINLIIEEISNLALRSEYNGIKTMKSYNDEYNEIDLMYDIKGRIMDEIKAISDRLASRGFTHFNELSYSSLYPYIPMDRFNHLLEGSNFGDTTITTMVGLMYACGIGTEKNLDLALVRFKQSAFWGYTDALSFAGEVLKIKNDPQAKIFAELDKLSSLYLYNGLTIIPDSDKDNYSEEAKTSFSLISSIYQDIVLGEGRINICFSFLEVIFMEKLSYSKKIDFINNFSNQAWKELSNSSKKPERDGIGFKLY